MGNLTRPFPSHRNIVITSKSGVVWEHSIMHTHEHASGVNRCKQHEGSSGWPSPREKNMKILPYIHSCRSCSFNSPACHLSPVEAGEGGGDGVLILAPLNLRIRCREDDFDMAWVALVGVDTTVGTVSATAGFLWTQIGVVSTTILCDSRMRKNVRVPAGRQCS